MKEAEYNIQNQYFKKRIIWVNDIEDINARLVFETLNFVFDYSNAYQHDLTKLSSLAALVYFQPETKPRKPVAELFPHIHQLLEYGVMIYFIYNNDPENHIEVSLRNISKDKGKEFETYTADEPLKLRNRRSPFFLHLNKLASNKGLLSLICEQLVKPNQYNLASDLVVLPDDIVDASEELLLRRSFYVGGQLRLKRFGAGNSSEKVFKAFYTPSVLNVFESKNPNTTSELVYFVKVGNRKKIEKEWDKYKKHVYEKIPFHLSPKLVESRCVLGNKKGVIVGDFVEWSESLINCINTNRASPIIASLFDRTLQSWHHNIKTETQPIWSNNFKSIYWRLFRARLTLAKNVEPSVYLRPQVLVSKLQKKLKPEDLYCGTIHGDLHADNILARNGDAVLIDFYSSEDNKPLLRDYASLESSVLVNAVSNHDFEQIEWLLVIKQIYMSDDFNLPEIKTLSSKYSWIVSCIRQIRLYVNHLELRKGQYATALGCALLEKSTKDNKKKMDMSDSEWESDNYRRAMAYVLACKLLG